MSFQHTRRLATGLATFVPGVRRLGERRTGGTSDARYCYSTWLRHRRFIAAHGFEPPTVVAELGPGDSLGTGLAALLTGVDRYYAFDIRAYADEAANVRMLSELVRLVRSRSAISASVYEAPPLRETAFPDDVDADALLDPARVEAVGGAASDVGVETAGLLVSYEPAWTTQRPGEQVDAIFSQAVLEHVDDLPAVYRAMYEWVRPGGCISHEIDFTSHGFARDWNGHWTFSEREWQLVRGRRRWAINREPLSSHVSLLERAGFAVVDVQKGPGPALDRRLLARRYRELDETDLRTASAFILARRA